MEADSPKSSVESEAILKRAVRETFHTNGPIQVSPVSGGYVVAVIDARLAANPPAGNHLAPLFQRLASENGMIAEVDQRIVLWNIDFFQDDLAAFSVRALLRTTPSEYQGGIFTVTRRALDAEVKVHALDAGSLLIDPTSVRDCRVKPETAPTDLIRVAHYRELDFHGLHFGVTSVDAQNGIWVAHLN